MFKFLCFFFGLMFILMIGNASPMITKAPVKQKLHLRTDSTAITYHAFNKSEIQQYAKDKSFNYNSESAVGLTLWDRFWRWVWGVIGDIFDRIRENKASWFLFRTVLFLLAAALLIFIVFRLAGIDILRVLKGESKNIEIPYCESLENIYEINFDNEIENAVSSRNYRLAVRLLYLRCLKQLSDAQLIHWQIEKTNTSYLNELNDTEYRQLFSLLTTQFEYIWYGDFPVDGQSFQNINTLFIDFKKGLP